MDFSFIFCLIWLLAAGVQIWYWIVPWRTIATQSTSSVPVSVIVCVHRSVKQLGTLLSRLRVQDYPDFEVIIVNDGPDPEIHAYLKTVVWEKLSVVDYDATNKKVPGKKEPLTAGIRTATSEWVLLTDADCLPGPHWISSMVSSIRPEAELVLGFAPFLRESGMRNLLQRFDALAVGVQYLGAALRGWPYMGVGRNLMYTKSLFDAGGGFRRHAHLISGDDDLFVQSAVGKTEAAVCANPAAFVYSESPGSWIQWFQQKRRHLSVSHRYSAQSKLLTSGFALSWLVTWIGYPFVLICAIPWWLPMLLIVVLWIQFARQSIRLTHQDLIPWFPVLAYCYCIVMLVFGILLTFKPPRTWSTS